MTTTTYEQTRDPAQRQRLLHHTNRSIDDADRRFGADPADLDSLTRLVDAADDHAGHIGGTTSARDQPTSRGETA